MAENASSSSRRVSGFVSGHAPSPGIRREPPLFGTACPVQECVDTLGARIAAVVDLRARHQQVASTFRDPRT